MSLIQSNMSLIVMFTEGKLLIASLFLFKVLGRESLRSEAVDKKQDSSTQAWSTKSGPQGL